MDREAALTLLRKGPEGIAEWNNHRKSGGRVPDLNGADLSRTHLRGADLTGANLQKADLRWADLHMTYMGKVNLNEANLTGADLTGADLTGADLNHAWLREAKLSKANLYLAHLCNANLGRAKLDGSNLSHADLSEAYLSEADLNGADLSAAELSGADLSGADGRGADFSTCVLTPRGKLSFLQRLKAFARRRMRKLSWQTARAVGSLQVLTKASYIMLALVPILAAVWQGVNVWTGHAKLETAAAVHHLDEKLGQQAEKHDGDSKAEIERVRAGVSKAQAVVDGLNPRLPTAWVWGYLAALFVVGGHFVYQMFCPEVVKENSPANYAEDHLTDFSAPNSNQHDHLVRAVNHLKELAAGHPDWRNANLINRHGRVVWIPDQIHMFEDNVVPPEKEGDQPTTIAADPGLKPIAIEEGAWADYQRRALTNRAAAVIALACYAVAGAFIAVIVGTQTIAVFKAAFG